MDLGLGFVLLLRGWLCFRVWFVGRFPGIPILVVWCNMVVVWCGLGVVWLL